MRPHPEEKSRVWKNGEGKERDDKIRQREEKQQMPILWRWEHMVRPSFLRLGREMTQLRLREIMVLGMEARRFLSCSQGRQAQGRFDPVPPTDAGLLQDAVIAAKDKQP